MTKANDHKLVRELVAFIKRNGLKGVVMVGVANDGTAISASAGATRKICDALGPVLREPEIDALLYDVDSRVLATEMAKENGKKA